MIVPGGVELHKRASFFAYLLLEIALVQDDDVVCHCHCHHQDERQAIQGKPECCGSPASYLSLPLLCSDRCNCENEVGVQRLHAQFLTLAALAGAAVVEYYDHKTGTKADKYARKFSQFDAQAHKD
ncbi:hypothetical protein EJ110_NYTH31032 [Nymphaea thermarum]|nr:hypothetical protein EJ110_NYTH31032 [Nymphaea thermarum]